MAEKVVKGSDGTLLKFLSKKLGTSLISDLSNAELEASASTNSKVELNRRKILLSKSFKDRILRDYTELGGKFGTKRVGAEARNANLAVKSLLQDLSKAKILKTMKSLEKEN